MPVTASARRPSAADIEAGNRSLKVGGITPLSLTDFPGRRAAVIFVQGCPWKCGYCQNPHLQLRLHHSPLQWTKILGLLRQRAGQIEAVVFSGGEPTLDPALAAAMQDVRRLGLRVGLQCGGAYPNRLESVLPLLDWVALDIKAPFALYERVTGIAGSGEQALQCAQAVLASGVAHEFRSTWHPSLLTADEMSMLADDLHGMGVRQYALQMFRPQGCRDKGLRNSGSGSADALQPLLDSMAALFPSFSFRPA